MSYEVIDELIPEIETDLGLPTGFLVSLAREDNWSLVIKVHAVLEAAVAHVLAVHTDIPATLDLFARLDMSDKHRGKVAFAKAFGVLDERHRRFLRFLSELRNDLVHDVRNVGFSFVTHLRGLDPNQTRSFVDGAGAMFQGETWTNEARREMVTERPEFTIWMATVAILATCYTKKGILQSDRKLAEMSRKFGEDMMALHEEWRQQDEGAVATDE